jgi:hypothetical protein
MWIRLILFVSIAILATLPSRSQADEKPAEEPVNHFASPREAFDAYRRTLKEHDWRAFYFCFTPKGREEAVCDEVAFLTPYEDKPEVIALRKKYGIELGVIEEEFMRRYGAKHGVDVTKDIADMKLEVARIQAGKKESRKLTGDVDKTNDPAETNTESKDSSDDELWPQAVLARISDKVGFYVDASKTLDYVDAPKTLDGDNNAPAERLGDLGQVKVEGDRAVGQTTTIQYETVHYDASGKPYPKVPVKKPRLLSSENWMGAG